MSDRPIRTARDGAQALRDALHEQGGTVAEVLGAHAGRHATSRSTAQVRHRSPPPGRAPAAREREYELLLEMILEGYRLHYDEPLVVHTPDADLALLLGDQLYALGLSRLAALGDLDAVAELADVISLVAQAHAVSDRELASAVWEAGAVRSAGARATPTPRPRRVPACTTPVPPTPCARRLVRFVASPRRPACEVRIEVVRPARTAPSVMTFSRSWRYAVGS